MHLPLVDGRSLTHYRHWHCFVPSSSNPLSTASSWNGGYAIALACHWHAAALGCGQRGLLQRPLQFRLPETCSDRIRA